MNSSVVGDINKKLGPLPVWAWGAIGTVGLLGYQWWHNRTSTPATTTTDPTTGNVVPPMPRGHVHQPRIPNPRQPPRRKPPRRKPPHKKHHPVHPGETMAENQEVLTDPASNNFVQRPPTGSTFGIENVQDEDTDSIVQAMGQPFIRKNTGSSIGGFDSAVS